MTIHGLMVALLLTQVDAAPPGRPQAPPPAPAAAATLTLDDALRIARARNLDLKVAQARLDQSKEFHWKAWSAYLPQVFVSGTYTHNNVSDVTIAFPVGATTENVVIQKQEQLAGQLQVTQA